ncbi:TPA: hypothetical protein GXZ54_07440 [bacterium]|jgi:thiamine transporter|nr:hypothetical protein [bacterium]
MSETRKMSFTAMMVSLSIVFELIFKFVLNPFLSAIPVIGIVFNMPYGGTVSLTMLPLIIVSYRLGFSWGLLSGIIYGIINQIIDGQVYHWASLFLDYVLAFGLISLSSLFRKNALNGNKVNFILGMIVGAFMRYLMHSLSGVLIFAEYTPEGTNPFVYSFVLYNGPYMSVSLILCIVVGLVIYPQLKKLSISFS